MCTTVIANGMRIETIRELVAFLGGKDRVWVDQHYQQDLDDLMDACLCPIDLDRTLRDHGFRPEVDCGDYIIDNAAKG